MAAVIGKWLARRAARTRAKHTTRHDVRGFPVTLENPYPDIEASFVLERLDAALGLIEAVLPPRFRHMRRDFAGIWVTRYPCRGAYFPAQRVCMTEVTFLNRAVEFSTAQVAASILHEGVHARIDQMRTRLQFAGRWSSADEERLCRRAEIAFASKLPAELAVPIVERAQIGVAGNTDDEAVAPTVDWRQAQLNKLGEDLKQLGSPRWVQRVALALARLR